MLYKIILFCFIFNYQGIRNSLGQSTINEESPRLDELENYFNDIDVNDENAEEQLRNAVNSRRQLWPNRTIPFQISTEYNSEEANTVREALEHFNSTTCLRFIETDDMESLNEQQYVVYRKDPNKCGTKVGYDPMKSSGPHFVSLSEKCLQYRGIVQHETMHVMGLYHEQSRYDRDKHVKIIYSNIAPKYQMQFVRYPPIYTNLHGIPYDYDSIMHYPSNAFATDPSKPTIQAIDGSGVTSDRAMGRRDGPPTQNDIDMINLMYQCSDAKPANE